MVLKWWFYFLFNKSICVLYGLPFLKQCNPNVSIGVWAVVLLMAHTKKLHKGLSFSLNELKLELDRFTTDSEYVSI